MDFHIATEEHQCLIKKRHPSEALGLRLHTPPGTTSCQIQSIVPGSPAGRSQSLSIGDTIIGIEGVPVEGLPHSAVVALIRDAGDRFQVSVARPPSVFPLDGSAARHPSPVRSLSLARTRSAHHHKGNDGGSNDGGSNDGASRSASPGQPGRDSAASLSDKLDFGGGDGAATRTVSGGGLGKPLPVGVAASQITGGSGGSVDGSDSEPDSEPDASRGHHANSRNGRLIVGGAGGQTFGTSPAGLTLGLPMDGIDVTDLAGMAPLPPSSPSSATPPGSPLRQSSLLLIAPAAPVRPTAHRTVRHPAARPRAAMAPLTATTPRHAAPLAYTEITTRYPSTIGMFATAVADPAALHDAIAAVAVAVAMAGGLAGHLASTRPDFECIEEISPSPSPSPSVPTPAEKSPAPWASLTASTTTAAPGRKRLIETGYSFMASSAAPHNFDSGHSDVDSDQHSSSDSLTQHGDHCDSALETSLETQHGDLCDSALEGLGDSGVSNSRFFGAGDGSTMGPGGGGVVRRLGLGLDASFSAPGSDTSASASDSMETPPASPQMRQPDYTPEHAVRRGLTAPKKKKRPMSTATLREATGKGILAKSLSPSMDLLHAFKKKGAGRSSKRPAFALSGHELMMLQTLHRRMRSSEVPNGMLTETLLIRCLMARDWNVADAEILLLNYAHTLCPEVDPLKIAAKDVLKQLQTGAMALTGGISVDGGPVLEFVAGRYNRDKHTPFEVLRSMLYLIEQAYRTGGNDTLRCGVSIVMDLRSMPLYAFDYKFIKLLFKTIQARYPVQIHSIHIISNTLFVKTVVAMCGQTMSRALRKKIKVHKEPSGVFKWVYPDQLTINFDGILNYQHGEWLYAQLLTEGEHDVGYSSGGSDSGPIRRKQGLSFARGAGAGGSPSSMPTGLPGGFSPAEAEGAKRPRSQSYSSVPGVRSRTPNTLETAQNTGLYSEMKGKMVGAVRLVGDLFRASRATRANVLISAEVNRPSAGRVGGRDI